jgi:hypothetical protein
MVMFTKNWYQYNTHILKPKPGATYEILPKPKDAMLPFFRYAPNTIEMQLCYAHTYTRLSQVYRSRGSVYRQSF